MNANPAKRPRLFAAALLLATLVPTAALAHPGHDAGSGFLAGVMHPLSGLDHVLMIVAVSAWAAAMKPAERLLVAACLGLFVAAGALIPGPSGRGLEVAIALTVVGSGLLLAFGRRGSLAATAALAAVFALVHGFAHGAEGPAQAGLFVPGLAVTTAGLAIAVSFSVARMQNQRHWLRAAGVLGALTGFAALLG